MSRYKMPIPKDTMKLSKGQTVAFKSEEDSDRVRSHGPEGYYRLTDADRKEFADKHRGQIDSAGESYLCPAYYSEPLPAGTYKVLRARCSEVINYYKRGGLVEVQHEGGKVYLAYRVSVAGVA